MQENPQKWAALELSSLLWEAWLISRYKPLLTCVITTNVEVLRQRCTHK